MQKGDTICLQNSGTVWLELGVRRAPMGRSTVKTRCGTACFHIITHCSVVTAWRQRPFLASFDPVKG